MSGLDRARDELIQALLLAMVRRMPEKTALVLRNEVDNPHGPAEGLEIKREADGALRLRVIQVDLPPGYHPQ